MSGDFSYKGGAFPGTGGTCTSTLAGSSTTCDVILIYTPTAVGMTTSDIDITYHNGVIGGNIANRGVEGTGQIPADIQISDADPFSFGTIANGATLTHTFTLTNVGGVDATNINGLALTVPFEYEGGGAFPGATGTCVAAGTLFPSPGPGHTCTVVVTYSPTSNGCLLYTSPSPRDQRGSRMPSSA